MNQESPSPGWYLNSAGDRQWWDGAAWGPIEAAEQPSAAMPARPDVQPTQPRKDPSWGKTIAWLLAAAIVAFLLWGLPAINRVKPADMASECVAAVAAWANVDTGEVDWVDVSDENFSGTAWDFRGSYPGGTWGCGGASDEREPKQIVVYPTGDIAVVLK